MNILVIGSGGREHAISWKIVQSDKCENLYVAPGNAGTDTLAQNINLGVNDFEGIAAFALEKNIALIIVGPEEPLVRGIVDYFECREDLSHIGLVGPGKEGAQLEGSKDFSKAFMEKHNIPTAKYRTFIKDDLEEGLAYIDSMNVPVVLKADGLAAGKGVIIAESHDEAKTALREMLVDAKFGEASSKVVIEEFLRGIELSVFVLTDGKNYKILPEAKDYKRIGEGDTGLNTGGMGALSPVPFASGEFLRKVDETIVKPTLNGLIADNIKYKGFIFIGLMNVAGTPYVIEYNVRMGDPETEVVFPRISSDVVDLFQATANQTLNEIDLKIDERAASTVVLVAGGYPEAYNKGDEITGLDNVTDVIPFHAGTLRNGEKIVTNGGRVIAVSALGTDIMSALAKSNKAAETIQWDKRYYRTDIGFDLMEYVGS